MTSVTPDRKNDWTVEAVKLFSEWDKSFYLWKSFSGAQSALLKSYVGLALFGTPKVIEESDTPKLDTIWLHYSDDERETILEIVEKFKFENDRITLSHTYLYLDSRQIVCVFRRLTSKNEIVFFDHLGRVYESWDNFCCTNRLPSCRYVAPIDGVHKINQELFIYQSPAATPGYKLRQATDVVAGTLSFAAVGLISVAPLTALVLGTASTFYGVGRSIGVLHDRSSHEESIGLDNAESVVAWFNIGTSGLTAASSMAFSQSAQIVEASGNYGNLARIALKGVNYVALTSNLCNFGTYLYFLREKIVNGKELTTLDYLELGVNLFLVAGAVANTHQMNNYINSLESTPTTVAGRLTKTAKRTLQRLRASLCKNGVDSNSVAVNGDVNEVMVLEKNIPGWGINFISIAGQRFLNKHFNIQQIYYKCLEIWHTFCDFRYNKIGAMVFVCNMTNHLQNLFILVSEAVVSIKTKAESFLNQYFYRNAPDSLTDQIGLMIQNTTKAVTNVDAQLLEDENEDEEQLDESEKLKYEIILETALNGIPRTTDPREVICAFAEELRYLLGDIVTESEINYEHWVRGNIHMQGRVKADEMFSKLGMKTVDDFANLNFYTIIEKKNNRNNSVGSFDRSVNESIMREVFTSYKTILSKVKPESVLSELGALKTCRLLEHSVFEFFEPLGERFRNAKCLYEMNVEFVGRFAAMDMVLHQLKISPRRVTMANYLTFFDLVAESLNFDQIAQRLSEMISTENLNNKVSSQLTDDNVHTTVLLLCDKFYRKVEPQLRISSDDEREKRVKDCYRFLMEHFTLVIEELEKEQSTGISQYLQLQNPSYFDKRSFVKNYERVCALEKQQYFASAVEQFTAEENLADLAEKYISTRKTGIDNFYVPVCDEISNAEDGMRIYSINEGGYSNLRAYKRTAAEVLGLSEHQMELIKWEKGAVIFKCGYSKNVVFQTVDTKSMILMEVDTSKEPNLQ